MKPKAIKKFETNISENRIQQNLEIYRDLAQSLGATDSKIISTDDIIIDERVRERRSPGKSLGVEFIF